MSLRRDGLRRLFVPHPCHARAVMADDVAGGSIGVGAVETAMSPKLGTAIWRGLSHNFGKCRLSDVMLTQPRWAMTRRSHGRRRDAG
jgi:hypothetical protein